MFNLKHVLTNLVGSALPILIVIVSVPLYLHAIGVEKFGILSIIWIVFGYFGVLDFGVSRAVTNAISRVRADGPKKVEIICSAGVLSAGIGIIVSFIGGVAFFIYTRYEQQAMLTEVAKALPLMMLGIPVLMVTSTLNGALDGEERFKTANSIQVIGSIMYQLVPLGTAYTFSTQVAHLINSVILCRFLVLLLYCAAVERSFGVSRLMSVTHDAMVKLLKFGSSIALINILDPIFTRIDQLVIARLAGAHDVAAYNIAVNSIGRLGILPMAMSRSAFPSLSTDTIENNASKLFVARGKIMIAWFVICAAAMLVSDIVFHLWLQNEISVEVSAIAKVFVVGLWANCMAILPYTALQAAGKSTAILKAHLLELPFYLIALVSLTYWYGAMGAAIAYGLRSFADYVILWKMCRYPVMGQKMFTALFFTLSATALLLSLGTWNSVLRALLF